MHRFLQATSRLIPHRHHPSGKEAFSWTPGTNPGAQDAKPKSLLPEQPVFNAQHCTGPDIDQQSVAADRDPFATCSATAPTPMPPTARRGVWPASRSARASIPRSSPRSSSSSTWPLMHSENLADQEACVALCEAAGAQQNIDYAHLHRNIIARFGRFRHRNAALGRTTTPE